MQNNKGPKIDIICPLYNASKYIEKLHESFLMQEDVKINKITYLLTESKDDSEKLLKRLDCNYKLIKKKDFSHSLTRESTALESESDILVFVTQDVIIESPNWLYNLTKDLGQDWVAASYSRQISKYNNIEKYTREKNYPDKSFIVSKNDVKNKGIKTFFFSDASSAILTSVFKELNGYDKRNLPTNEDMYIAYKIIMKGYKIKYCANSVVYHSHSFTLKELYNRYKLTGKFFKENAYFNKYKVTKAGSSLAKYVLKRIFEEHRFLLLLQFPFDMAARFIGMKAGKR